MIQAWAALLVLLVAFVPGMSMGQVLPTDPGRLIDYRKKQADDPGGETKPGRGTTYYFSTSGDDSRDCKSREAPCKSTDRAAKVVRNPGDTGLFKRGDTWADANFLRESAPGSENAPIVWGAYGSSNSPRPVFSVPNNSSVAMRGRAYLHIDRLDFRKMQVVRLHDRTHDIKFTYVRFREAGNACVSVLGKRDTTEAYNIEFHKVMVEKCGLVGNNGEGFYVSESKDRLGKGGRDVLIKDSVIRNTRHEPINVKGGTRRVIVDGTIVYDYNPVARSSKKDPGLHNARNSDDPRAGHVIKNSIFIANRGYGSSSDAAIFLPNSGVTAFNNLIWGNSMYCFRGSRGGRAYLNTCYSNKRGFLNPQTLDGPQLSMDDLRCNIGISSGNNISGADSMFMDAGSGDLRLRKQIQGCDLNGEMTDILGRERKGTWSYGAFQHVEGEPPGPQKPQPVGIQWCECGCDADTDEDVDESRASSLPAVEVCTKGCAACSDDGGVNVPLEEDTVIGPGVY